MKTTHVAALFGLFLGYSVSAALAEEQQMPDVSAMSVDELVSLRQEIMKEDGQLLRSASKMSGEEAALAAETLAHNVAILKTLFPEGSISPDSKTLDVVWSDWDGFIALFDEIGTHAGEMAVAARAGDSDLYMTSFKAAAGVCGDCHTQYRAP